MKPFERLILVSLLWRQRSSSSPCVRTRIHSPRRRWAYLPSIEIGCLKVKSNGPHRASLECYIILNRQKTSCSTQHVVVVTWGGLTSSLWHTHSSLIVRNTQFILIIECQIKVYSHETRRYCLPLGIFVTTAYLKSPFQPRRTALTAYI